MAFSGVGGWNLKEFDTRDQCIIFILFNNINLKKEIYFVKFTKKHKDKTTYQKKGRGVVLNQAFTGLDINLFWR